MIHLQIDNINFQIPSARGLLKHKIKSNPLMYILVYFNKYDKKTKMGKTTFYTAVFGWPPGLIAWIFFFQKHLYHLVAS